jgi:hypothetical protein
MPHAVGRFGSATRQRRGWMAILKHEMATISEDEEIEIRYLKER